MVKFNLQMNIVGLDCDRFKFVNMRDRSAKIINVVKEKNHTVLVVDSIYTHGELEVLIESVWMIKKKQKTFKIIESILNIPKLDIVQNIYKIPSSHRAALRRWYKIC